MKKIVYEWCRNCSNSKDKNKSKSKLNIICLPCIRLTLEKQKIKISKPESFTK